MDPSASELFVAPVEPWATVRRLLSADEIGECESSAAPVADRLATSRGLLRRLAERYAEGPGGTLPVRRVCAQCGSTAHGRPELVGGPEVSLSRCDRYVVALVSGARCGVDVERLDPGSGHLHGIAATVLGARERAALEQVAPADRRMALLQAWTRKEAVLKAEGTGLLRDPAGVPVDGDQAVVDGRVWWLTTTVLAPEDVFVSTASTVPLDPLRPVRRHVSDDAAWR